MAKSSKLYDTLGVGVNATKDEIKRAYHKKAKEHHPDTESGSKEKFHEVSHAYEILFDPLKREKYDKTGDDSSKPSNENAEIYTLIMRAFSEIFYNSTYPESIDIVSEIKKVLNSQKQNIEKEIKKSDLIIAKCERVIHQFKKKSKGANIFVSTLNNTIKQENEKKEKLQANIVLLEKATELTSDYIFDVDENLKDANRTLDFMESIINEMRFKRF